MDRVRIYLSPGMFGFGRLASFEYFEHIVRALEDRYLAQSQPVSVQVCEVHPTASLRRRAARLAEVISETSRGDDGPIHILGHSTGGLDARLVASPSVHLGEGSLAKLVWLHRLRSITTMNTPHYGTPLAAFFATVSGQRLLYAVTALTVAALKLGAPPLSAASALVAALGRVELGGLELTLLDRTTESLIRVLDEASSHELRTWLRLLRDDQGAIVQLTPEAMDLFQAGIEDHPNVVYQCVATYAPQTEVLDWFDAIRSPVTAVSAAIFTALYNISSRIDARYPCRPSGASIERMLRAALGGPLPPATANDGVVPFYSQVWGNIVWAGRADHLDVVGHFPGVGGHTDWLTSGAHFSRMRFDLMMDKIVDGMRASEFAATSTSG